MHDYSMFEDGDRVMVGVSGGVDSSVLAYILKTWLAKAPIRYDLVAVYIDDGFWQPEFGGEPPSKRISTMLDSIGIEFVHARARALGEQKRTCFLCSRNRRSQLFDLAHEWQINKIALGHHMDDLIETFFLNMMYGGNISTMVPKQSLFEGELHIIRPLAYIEKREIAQLADLAGIQPVENFCAIEKDTKRETVRSLLAEIYTKDEAAKKSIFTSMSNIRHGYMLKNPV